MLALPICRRGKYALKTVISGTRRGAKHSVGVFPSLHATRRQISCRSVSIFSRDAAARFNLFPLRVFVLSFYLFLCSFLTFHPSIHPSFLASFLAFLPCSYSYSYSYSYSLFLIIYIYNKHISIISFVRARAREERGETRHKKRAANIAALCMLS